MLEIGSWVLGQNLTVVFLQGRVCGRNTRPPQAISLCCSWASPRALETLIIQFPYSQINLILSIQKYSWFLSFHSAAALWCYIFNNLRDITVTMHWKQHKQLLTTSLCQALCLAFHIYFLTHSSQQYGDKLCGIEKSPRKSQATNLLQKLVAC